MNIIDALRDSKLFGPSRSASLLVAFESTLGSELRDGELYALLPAHDLRAGVTWGRTDCEGGECTPTQVPVFATGPWADQLDGNVDNADIGKLLLDAVSGT